MLLFGCDVQERNHSFSRTCSCRVFGFGLLSNVIVRVVWGETYGKRFAWCLQSLSRCQHKIQLNATRANANRWHEVYKCHRLLFFTTACRLRRPWHPETDTRNIEQVKQFVVHQSNRANGDDELTIWLAPYVPAPASNKSYWFCNIPFTMVSLLRVERTRHNIWRMSRLTMPPPPPTTTQRLYTPVCASQHTIRTQRPIHKKRSTVNANIENILPFLAQHSFNFISNISIRLNDVLIVLWLSQHRNDLIYSSSQLSSIFFIGCRLSFCDDSISCRPSIPISIALAPTPMTSATFHYILFPSYWWQFDHLVIFTTMTRLYTWWVGRWLGRYTGCVMSLLNTNKTSGLIHKGNKLIQIRQTTCMESSRMNSQKSIYFKIEIFAVRWMILCAWIYS